MAPALPATFRCRTSSLLRWRNFASACHARLIDDGGADVTSNPRRWPPGSLSEPDQRCPLSTLYGAAGSNHDPVLTKLLLDAGANPNDGESLYHSLENPACTRLLLEHGARIAESNAIYRSIDLDDDTALKLLLQHGGDPNEPAQNPPLTDWGSPLAWAIYRRRPRHAKVLLAAGADPSRRPFFSAPTVWRCGSAATCGFAARQLTHQIFPKSASRRRRGDEADARASVRGPTAGLRCAAR